MEQVNISYQTKKKSCVEQGVEKVKIEVINQKENVPFLQAVESSKKIVVDNIQGNVVIWFKDGENLVDNYTVEELFELIKKNATDCVSK